jgi:RsiW-degrading membrane proteinase PrsW (M82 family)
MHCEHCGREAPEGHFCAYCGAHLPAADAGHSPTLRRHVYAANPREHVYQPNIISTFFPHLDVHRAQQFRWLLLVLGVAVVLLGLGRYVPIAIVAAALLVPVLYLAYFYVVEIYEDEPIWVVGATFLLGGILGAALSIATYRLVLSQTQLSVTGVAPTPRYVLLTGIVLPVAGQILMLVGPLILYVTRPRFNEVLDGLVFGVASGLGFAAAQSIVYSWLLITGPLQPNGNPVSWALPVVRIALLVPLLYAATTGLICAALWLRRDTTPIAHSIGPLAGLPAAVTLALLGLIVPSVGVIYFGGQLLNLIWYGGALVVLMLVVRHVLHVGLIEKARELGHAGTLRCPNCFHMVPDVPFCPNCGVAMRSLAKRARRAQAAGPAPGQDAGQSPAQTSTGGDA